MPTTSLLVLSDLHLADHCNVLEGFHAAQQAALEGLLHAALPGGSLEIRSTPTLIINGDCFDFLTVPPYAEDGSVTPGVALEKLERIASAHEPFFATLRAFLAEGGSVRFLSGNHDVELCFAEVRRRVTQLLDPLGRYSTRLHFCLERYYRPVRDVWIEHGNEFDFWNHIYGIWRGNGRALAPDPARIELPLGTQYMHQAALGVSRCYPYFDHFDPPLGIMQQTALLSLFHPALLVETMQGVASLIAHGFVPLQDLAPGDERIPALLFAHAMSDFATFQQQMSARVPSWQKIEKRLYSDHQLAQRQAKLLERFFRLQVALAEDEATALRAIFQPPLDRGDEDTSRGMLGVLRRHADVRVASAGHTHVPRATRLAGREQLYLNTATWTQRLALPTPDALTPELVDWLRAPKLEDAPLIDKTGYVFAHIEIPSDQPSTAHLYQWKDGSAVQYHA